MIFMHQSFPTASPRQRSIVVGHLLGDGYLYKDGRLQVEQSIRNRTYVKWLHRELSTLSGNLSVVERTHSKTGIKSSSCRFYTKKCFSDLESIFYKNIDGRRVKVVPESIDKLLDPVGLAVWFMDDGGKAQNTPRAAYINVTNFTDSGRLKLQQMFKEVFGLKINIHKAGGNNQYNFYIPADSYELFYQFVLPTVSLVPAMRYKLAEKKILNLCVLEQSGTPISDIRDFYF